MNVQNEAARRFHNRLTTREVSVLSLVAGGLSTKEVALHLEIAPSTVESHLESAKSKLGARSRPNLIARAIGCGLVDPLVEAGLPRPPAAREIEVIKPSPVAAARPG